MAFRRVALYELRNKLYHTVTILLDYDTIMLMVAFGGFIVSLIGLVLLIVRLIRK